MIPNLLVSISAPPKSGKTYWTLTFPEPILLFSFDIGVERVLPHFKDKKIEVKTYPIPILDTLHPKPYARAIWTEVVDDFKDALSGDKYATIAIDTATALYELARHAYTEEIGAKQLMPYQYGEVFARMSALYTNARLAGKNLVLTHYLRERYRNDQATGEMELDGYKRTEGLVDIVLLTERVKNAKGNTVIRTSIIDCGYDLALCGYQGENMTYQTLIELLGLEG